MGKREEGEEEEEAKDKMIYKKGEKIDKGGDGRERKEAGKRKDEEA